MLYRGEVMKHSLLAIAILISTQASASELIFQFNSPAFSGQGYGTHVLTIEQLEHQRIDRIRTDELAALDRADRELRGTNAYRFRNNLESRIYAQLSRQIADNIFGESGSESDSGIIETPFGDVVSWFRSENSITIRIVDPNGMLISEFVAPMGEFSF